MGGIVGIGFAIVFIELLGLATIAAVVLPLIAALLTPGVGGGRKRLIVATALFPYACVAWEGGALAFYAHVNDIVFHRDPGFGETVWCPLTNGYRLYVSRKGGPAYLSNGPSGQSITLTMGRFPTVSALQVAGPYVLGATCEFHSGYDADSVRPYFLLDTRTGERADFLKEDDLRAAAAKLNIQLRIEGAEDVYGRYRPIWFDQFYGMAIYIPILGLCPLVIWTIRIRKSRRLTPQPA